MSRDLQDENYYISNSRRIPVKWTAPEVNLYLLKIIIMCIALSTLKLNCFIKSQIVIL